MDDPKPQKDERGLSDRFILDDLTGIKIDHSEEEGEAFDMEPDENDEGGKSPKDAA